VSSTRDLRCRFEYMQRCLKRWDGVTGWMMVADARRVSAETPRTFKLKDKKRMDKRPVQGPSMQNEGSRRTLARCWKTKVALGESGLTRSRCDVEDGGKEGERNRGGSGVFASPVQFRGRASSLQVAARWGDGVGRGERAWKSGPACHERALPARLPGPPKTATTRATPPSSADAGRHSRFLAKIKMRTKWGASCCRWRHSIPDYK
jgi:hypothetical protein